MLSEIHEMQTLDVNGFPVLVYENHICLCLMPKGSLDGTVRTAMVGPGWQQCICWSRHIPIYLTLHLYYHTSQSEWRCPGSLTRQPLNQFSSFKKEPEELLTTSIRVNQQIHPLSN